jgi:tetratricopeptide (TPR) repeat protein
MAYAHLQLGEDQRAKQIVDELKVSQMGFYPNIGTYTGMIAPPARYYLERQDWKGAAQLQPLGSPYPAAEAITHFARAMGAARSGDAAAAQADVEKLKELRAELEKAKQSYWAEQVEVQILGAQAWLAQAQGSKDEALKFMRAAADLEDGSEKHVAMENRLYPMRELLGDMLREQGQPALALKEYEASAKNAPMRLRGFCLLCRRSTPVFPLSTSSTHREKPASWRPRHSLHGRNLRREAVVDPGAKPGDVVRRPGPVARHGAVGEPCVDDLGIGANVVVGRQIEDRGHRAHVAVAKQRPDVPRERHVLSHPSLLPPTTAPKPLVPMPRQGRRSRSAVG